MGHCTASKYFHFPTEFRIQSFSPSAGFAVINLSSLIEDVRHGKERMKEIEKRKGGGG